MGFNRYENRNLVACAVETEGDKNILKQIYSGNGSADSFFDTYKDVDYPWIIIYEDLDGDKFLRAWKDMMGPHYMDSLNLEDPKKSESAEDPKNRISQKTKCEIKEFLRQHEENERKAQEKSKELYDKANEEVKDFGQEMDAFRLDNGEICFDEIIKETCVSGETKKKIEAFINQLTDLEKQQKEKAKELYEKANEEFRNSGQNLCNIDFGNKDGHFDWWLMDSYKRFFYKTVLDGITQFCDYDEEIWIMLNKLSRISRMDRN